MTHQELKSYRHNLQNIWYVLIKQTKYPVCDSWKLKENFIDWALKNGYAPKLIVKRTNTKLGFSPENCVIYKRPSFLENFMAKVVKNEATGCWEWIGSKRGPKSHQYGVIRTSTKGTMSAHRVSYLIHHGEHPGDLMVCHKCDNTICVNPDHLFLGTGSDNAKDALKKGRLKTFKKGALSVTAKFTLEEARKIKEEIKNCGCGMTELSRRLGIRRTILNDIKSGRFYKNA